MSASVGCGDPLFHSAMYAPAPSSCTRKSVPDLKPNFINLESVYKNHLYFTYFLQVTIYEEINNELEVLKQQMDNEIKKLNTYFLDNEKVIVPNHRERIIIYDL